MAYPYSPSKSGPSICGNRLLAVCDELFLTLCILHAGLLEQDLADRFNMSVSTVSRICLAWINLLYVVLGSINIWPSPESIDKQMPAGIKVIFPNVCVIIDCTEIFFTETFFAFGKFPVLLKLQKPHYTQSHGWYCSTWALHIYYQLILWCC